MKFFTPELFVKLNSEIDDEVDEAESQWETARKQYQIHFKRIAAKLPKPFARLCNSTTLHDAVIERPRNPVWNYCEIDENGEQSRAIFSVRHLDAVYNLIYLDPVEPISIERPIHSPIFSDANVIWLYDEVSCKRRIITHEILISNGAVLSIKFKGFKYTIMPIVSNDLFPEAIVVGRHSASN